MLRGALALAALSLVASCMACSPVYVVKAGIAEVRILRARQPIARVLNDTTVDAATRGKLAYVVEARRFAADELGIDVGDSYTMYTELDRDTLMMVVSAAYKDRLVPKTWWFPVVGHVPYKGHFSLQSALDEQAGLEDEGYDTYIRPTAAFSTLGWFNDPILSTTLRADEVEVVSTVIHELSHQHLFVPGQIGFNESFATFVGRVGAARFFCSREGSGPDSVKCQRALARWRDMQRFSVFLDGFVEDLQSVYTDDELSSELKVERREAVFAAALERFDTEVAPTFEALTFANFRNTPLNNATLLSRIRYYNQLPRFDAFLAQHDGDLVSALDDLKARVGTVESAFDLLPPAANGSEHTVDPDSSPAHSAQTPAPAQQVVLVTGSTSGLGREVALRLGAGGAHVIVHGRNRERGMDVVEEINRGPGSARFYRADFASFDQVRTFGASILRDYDRLDVLVNNAGFGSAPDERLLSEDGHEFRFQVNYLSPFLLTRMLLPLIEASAPSRIVNVSSLAQQPIDWDDVMIENRFSGGRAYAQSKLAQVGFTFDLHEELAGSGVMVNALHPATYMPTGMVLRLGVEPRATIDEGATAVMQLITSNDIEGGQFFNGLNPQRAHAQAYDVESRRRLRELSRELTGIR